VVERTCIRRFGFFAHIDDRAAREILKRKRQKRIQTESGPSNGVAFHGFQSLRSEVAMSIFSYRKHLRFLSQTQRRNWWDQKKRLTPRVVIGGAYVPPNVTREFAYVKVG
jgi:hypothetical protein